MASEEIGGAQSGAAGQSAAVAQSGFGDILLTSAGNVFTGAVVSLVSAFPSVGGIAAKITTTVKKGTDLLDEKVKQIAENHKVVGGGGGGGGGKKNINKKIQQTTKRLNHLLQRFSSRRKKINYTKRLRYG